MARCVYIFGNGLGMAISPSAFSLTDVMRSVWQSPTLATAQKELIAACLPDGVLHPETEEQLEKLQEILGASERLLSVQKVRNVNWLTQVGSQFPEAVYKFLFSVARGMYLATHGKSDASGNPYHLPSEFIDSLSLKIKRDQSHIATLNYDGLISRSLSEKGMFDGSSPHLLDGFIESQFQRNHLFRKDSGGGWYLHLHGSPLFVDAGRSKHQKINEIQLRNSPINLPKTGRHIVLTHFTHKMGKIESSEILKTYWEFLELAIDESARLVLFGYSGNDLHLNRLVSQVRSNKEVQVVEWLGAGNKATRTKFWREQLGGDVNLRLMENILSFSDW